MTDPSRTDLILQSQDAIRTGSKSFSFASFFLPRNAREGAWLLYAWCRFVDDQIDEAPTIEIARERLQLLRIETERAVCTRDPLTISECLALRALNEKYALPLRYPLDLLAGMQMDVDGFRYETDADLDLYCYRVAGTVGLMMSHVMGVSHERALEHAVSLGAAMQMTNISRDIREDLGRGRIYFPRSWMSDQEFANFADGHKNGLWQSLSRRLVVRADARYQHGREGLRFLAVRPAFAIAVASHVYRAIGHDVLKAKDWSTRVWIRPRRKFMHFLLQTVKVLPRFFPRLVVRWKPVQIQSVWKGSGE